MYAHCEEASHGKTREVDTCFAPALASYGGSRGARQRQFFDVFKGALLQVARSDWTAVRASLQNGQ
jgi:hypothetical protein